MEETQMEYTGEYFQAILTGLRKSNCHWRIQQQCARLTILISSENEYERFAEYTEEILNFYKQILENFNLNTVQSDQDYDDQKIVFHPMVLVQEDVLIAVAAMAEAMANAFNPVTGKFCSYIIYFS